MTAGRDGIVHLVGAGPGDPGLLTLRAAELLARADTVVYDRLVHPDVLARARRGARLLFVGKEGFGEQVPQAEICALLIEQARLGREVVRLKGGDPFVFGRGGEEALALEEAGVPYDVVPGVSSGVAGPGLAGIPVTHRGLPSEPAALVEAASLPQQRTVEGTLSSIAARAEAENVGSPALLVLGEVVGLRTRIARGLAAPFSEELPAQAAAAQPRSS